MKKFALLTSALLTLFTARLEAQVILQDSFTYANGTLTTVSANLWTNYSGAIDSQVNGGRLEVFGTRAGDVWRPFTNTPASILFASFIVNATNVTSSSNNFAHFSANSTTFRGRVFAIGNSGGAPNTWRLGITAAAANSPQIIPLDLATNVDYRVVVSYDTNALLGTLWIDPVSTNDVNKQTLDSTGIVGIGFFSFRQPGTTVSMSNMRVDDLYVGNSFADVNVGAVKPATVYYQPVPAVTIFENNNTNLSCVGGGAGTVTFQWQHEGTNLVDDANNVGTTSNRMTIVSAQTYQSGAYKCIVTSTTNSVFASSVTSAVAQVTVSVAPVPPTINSQPPTNQIAFRGATVTMSIGASGPGTITYQWKTNGLDIVGETSSSLVLVNVTTNNNATYRCGVSNVFGGVLSSNSVLTVMNPPAVSIAFLRTLVDTTTYLQTNSILPWEVTGTVTTFTNLTTGNTSSYYLQDGTGGINIFATFGSAFRPAQGDVVKFVGVLSSFNSTLELAADTTGNPSTSYTVLSNNIATLPNPKPIAFSITNNLAFCETNLEGSLVMLTNVYFGTNAGNFISTNANTTVVVTNANGESFIVFFSFQDLDTAGQTLPDFAYSVVGPFTQNLGNAVTPRNQGYNVTVTRFSDIVTNPLTLTITKSGNSSSLTWAAAPVTYPYTVLGAADVTGPYAALTNSLRFTNSSGTYTDPNVGGSQKYYRLTTP